MYLALLNIEGEELPLLRVPLFNTMFKLSPGKNGDFCTIVNTTPILLVETYASINQVVVDGLGLCDEVDSPIRLKVKLARQRKLRPHEGLTIAVGALVFGLDKIWDASGRAGYRVKEKDRS